MLIIGALVCLGLNLFAQTADSRMTEDANDSWTAVTDVQREHVVPARIVESHRQNGNRTLDKRSLLIARYAGQFEFYKDTETETVRVDASTVRITTRTFAQDGNGRRTLVDVTEESKHTLPNSDSNTVRITSRSDLNGTLQTVQREILETKSIDNDTEETNTTLLLPSINGGFAPAVKTQEVRKRSGSEAVQSQTTLLRDGAGNWQAREIRQNTTRQEPDNVSTEDNLLRCNAEGKLIEVSRVMSKHSDSSSGEKHDLKDTYSMYTPGASPNGSLQLVERATSTQRDSATGAQITNQQVERRDLGNPNTGLRVSIATDDGILFGPSGLQATRTIRTRNVNGSLEIIEIDTKRSDKVPTIQVR